TPIRIVKHQLNVSPFRDHMIQPFLGLVVLKDTFVEIEGLIIGDAVKVYPIKILERRKHVAIKASRAGIGKIVSSLGPPLFECAPWFPRCNRVYPFVVATLPYSSQGHATTTLGLHVAGQPIKGPKMVVSIYRRY